MESTVRAMADSECESCFIISYRALLFPIFLTVFDNNEIMLQLCELFPQCLVKEHEAGHQGLFSLVSVNPIQPHELNYFGVPVHVSV